MIIQRRQHMPVLCTRLLNVVNMYPYRVHDDATLLLPVSSANKTDRHDIAEILLKVALNTINLSQTYHTAL
jgi:hypothetical protein